MNFMQDIETAFSELATHLKPSAGSYIQHCVKEVQAAVSEALLDIRSEVADLRSRLDSMEAAQHDADKSLADATVGAPPGVNQGEPSNEVSAPSDEYHRE